MSHSKRLVEMRLQLVRAVVGVLQRRRSVQPGRASAAVVRSGCGANVVDLGRLY